MTALVPLIIWVSERVSGPMSRLGLQLQESLSDAASVAQDALKGIETVKSFCLEQASAHQYQEAVQRSVLRARLLASRNAVLTWSSVITGVLPFFVLFVLGGHGVIRGELSAGELIAFLNLFSYLTTPLSQMPALLGQCRTDMAAASRIFELLDQPSEETDGQKTEPVAGAPVIETRGLVFVYPKRNTDVLHGVALRLEPGQCMALVGASGGGKSTLIKLMLAMYQTYHGSIRILGHELSHWDIGALRSQMAFVSQDPFIFPGTVLENIAYGKPGASASEAIQAAESAGVDSFVARLPFGYNTPVGELGRSLSGGQRQRIAIARAIVRRAPILLLDEPTSALDSESQTAVEHTLANLMTRCTSVLATHSISMTRKADLVVVLNNGRVVECGSYNDLLERGGELYKLYSVDISEGKVPT